MREAALAGERFLQGLACGRGQMDASGVSLIIAHPDDEAVSCGGQLERLSGLSVVLVTDGAPRNLVDAKASGFETAAAYAQARAAEFCTAMQLANVERVVQLEIPDQEAARQLTPLARALADILLDRRIRVAVTHAFEGGHPDHDATAFAVHAAKGLLNHRNYRLDVLEVPLYHLGEQGMVAQCFADRADTGELRVPLDDEAQGRKRRLLQVYATQRQTLSPFKTDTEWFRVAPAYAFAAKPNAGRILYEKHPWGLGGDEWSPLARASLDQLGLERRE